MSVLPRQIALVSEAQSIGFANVTQVAAALQKQATRDFAPLWQVRSTVDAFENLEQVPLDYWPVIIMDDIKEPGAAGYHTDKNGQPYSLVQADGSWPLTVSHETLEMLADPFGNRVVAGAPPPQAPGEIQGLKRVLYLVEVCDPCESGDFAYTVNGIQVSDFITNYYYDPSNTTGRLYSFTGSVRSPHEVLEGGYVSFGNPVDNHWYQIIVVNGETRLEDLGVLQMDGKSIRENVDRMSRVRRPGYRTMAAGRNMEMARAAGAASLGSPESQIARASALREDIKTLK